ncbi:MAG TPA: SAM-dependent methyltransferase, partial [Terrimesophilobacter sp.]|nr:SAM-dependent methyltransferase [Terrimesophilobacter sp.]
EPDAGRRLKSWAMDAGFSDVTSTASVWGFNSEADREWWGSMWETRILQSALAIDAIDAGLAHQDDLIDISRAWRDWINEPDGWLAMPHGEVICRG